MYGYLSLLCGLSLLVVVLSLTIFKFMWLSRMIYFMPKSISYPHKHRITQDPRIETRLHRFMMKMIYYIFFEDRAVLAREIGFEQTYYLLFYRIFIAFFFIASIVVITGISFWSSLITSSRTILIMRTFQAKELILTTNDFQTFL